MSDTIDKEYKILQNEEKISAKFFRANEYKLRQINCCQFCKYVSRSTVSDPYICDKANPEGRFQVSSVDPLGICNSFKKSGQKGQQSNVEYF
ncbi:hypothetical protein [Leptospira brenneri]|uniref:hypothetical protein n=1 Tax=Leptospira brenneri TaxID=2023182 RepID=UPI000C2A9E90|nr:hypothetical protein [Leptospira brenneri]PJZ43688.1 hypothetical protein CH361_19110 [Leptospira brenneri]